MYKKLQRTSLFTNQQFFHIKDVFYELNLYNTDKSRKANSKKNYLTLWISCRSLISLSVKSHSKRILKKNKQAYFFTRYKQHAHALQKKKIRWRKKLFSFCKWVHAITTATKFTDESNTICLSLEFQQVNNHVFLTSSHWNLP